MINSMSVHTTFDTTPKLHRQWSIVFTVLGIPYIAEPETPGFAGHTLFYPDFWLPDFECWVFIPERAPLNALLDYARRLTMLTCQPVWMLETPPTKYHFSTWFTPYGARPSDIMQVSIHSIKRCRACSAFMLLQSSRGIIIPLDAADRLQAQKTYHTPFTFGVCSHCGTFHRTSDTDIDEAYEIAQKRKTTLCLNPDIQELLALSPFNHQLAPYTLSNKEP